MSPSHPFSSLILENKQTQKNPLKKLRWSMNKWTNEWMNAAFLSTVLGSCIIPSATEPVEGPFRTGKVSFSTYCHSWFISQIKLLASLSRWPDDLGCHVFIQAKWLVLWNISIGMTHKRPSLGKKEKFFLLGHLITQQSQSSDSCKNAPEHTDVNPINLALLFNMNNQENGTISKHSGEHATLKHSCMIKRWLIKLERI